MCLPYQSSIWEHYSLSETNASGWSVYIMLRKPEGPCLDDLWWLIRIYSDSRWGHFKWEGWKAINRFIQKNFRRCSTPPLHILLLTAHDWANLSHVPPAAATKKHGRHGNATRHGKKRPSQTRKGPNILACKKLCVFMLKRSAKIGSLQEWRTSDKLINEDLNGHILHKWQILPKLGTSINDHKCHKW